MHHSTSKADDGRIVAELATRVKEEERTVEEVDLFLPFSKKTLVKKHRSRDGWWVGSACV